MKPNEIINTALGLAVLIIIGLSVKMIFFSPRPIHIIDTKIMRDSVIVRDTIKIPKYIYITKLQAQIDTFFIDSSKVTFAHADTTIQKDSSKIKVSYYFPPKNFFEIALDLKERIIHELKTITETKTITLEQPWYKDMWFYSNILLLAILFLVK